MGNILELYEAEQGEPVAILVTNPDGKSIDISWAITSETQIFVKDKEDNVILTITNTSFTITTPNVIWTPTAAQMNALTVDIVYECFIHLTKTSTNRVKVAKFLLKKLNN